MNCILFVCNREYLPRLWKTVLQVRTWGRYRGDIVVIVGNDLKDSLAEIRRHPLRVLPHYLEDFDRNQALERLGGQAISDGREYKKTFQWHKMHCFDVFLRAWETVLYLDVGMQVFHPLAPFFNLETDGCLVAHSDAYPDHTTDLEGQFTLGPFPSEAADLKAAYDLNCDYFQTTMMLYSTKLIEEDTVSRLLELSIRYFFARTNEQAIMNLHFSLERRKWKPLPTGEYQGLLWYDFFERPPNLPIRYRMLKYPRTKTRFAQKLLATLTKGKNAHG